MKTLFTGVGGLAWAGLLSLTIPASAGQLDSKWNGSIEWNDDSYYNITSDCSSRHTVISQTHVDTQYLHDYAWENRYNRVISVDLANGGWTVGMRGNFHIVASDAVNHASFQPPRSSVDCQWLLDSEPPIEIGTTGGKLSVDTGNDCSYTIALNGLQGSCGGNYLLEACFDTQACGYVSVASAMAIGVLAALICYAAVVFIKQKFTYDDSLDAFGVHGIGGIVGMLATGLFARKFINAAGNDGLLAGNFAFFKEQALAVGVVILYSVAATYILLKIVDALCGLRVNDEEEVMGLDHTQHRESAYTLLD